MNEKIPTRLIGILSQIIPENYTHSEIESLFLYSGAPESIPDGSKPSKVQSWLRNINSESENPIKILESILSDFMEKEIVNSYWSQSDDQEKKLEEEKNKIKETLSKCGFSYNNGNLLKAGSISSTISLVESVKKHGLRSVDTEIKRALDQVDEDPYAATQYAANVLEASLKAYLDSKSHIYSPGNSLAELWRDASTIMGIKPKDIEDEDLRKIASSLIGIVTGVRGLRDKKSTSHGKSEDEMKKYIILPRHARLSIHSAHTVSAYILELI